MVSFSVNSQYDWSNLSITTLPTCTCDFKLNCAGKLTLPISKFDLWWPRITSTNKQKPGFPELWKFCGRIGYWVYCFIAKFHHQYRERERWKWAEYRRLKHNSNTRVSNSLLGIISYLQISETYKGQHLCYSGTPLDCTWLEYKSGCYVNCGVWWAMQLGYSVLCTTAVHLQIRWLCNRQQAFNSSK